MHTTTDDTKAAARRSPNCIKKTKKTFCGTWIYVALAKFSKKTTSQDKISLKSGNRLLSYGQDKIFNMACVRHPEYFKISYLVT